MKRKIMWMLAAILTICSTSVVTSCSEEDDNDSPKGKTDIEQQRLEEWEPCNKLTYISGIDSEDPDLQNVIRQRFPNQTQDLQKAEVAFVSIPTALSRIDELGDFYNRGGLIVMMRPSEEGFDSLGDGYLDDEDDGEEGYWDDEYNASEDFFASEEMDEVFFAYNKYEQHYTMYEEPEFDGKYTDEIKEMSADEWESIRQYNEQFPADSETKNAESLYDNDYDQNYNYFQARLDPFIDFIEDISEETSRRATRADDDGSDMKMEVEDGYFFVKDIPISLNHCIEKDYYWNKSSSVTLKYWVSSVYLLSSNGQSKAGDYYMVRSEITPHIKPLWEVAARTGGLFSWGRCRIYAYWFDNMTVEYELLDANNNSIANKIQYYKTPIPDNQNTEYSYSNGVSWSISGSGSLEIGKEGKKGSFSIGFTREVSSSVSYALKSIGYERNTSTTYPSFRYTAQNVKLDDDDYEDEAATNVNFPAIIHTEFSANTAWMWRVPRSSNLGADDNSTTHFNLRVKVKPVFASWYHWRGAVQYDSNKKTYNGYIASPFGWFNHTDKLPNPDRTPWGVIALKNAASSYTIGNIKIYKQEEFAAQGVKAPVYATISSSYNVNEVAKKYLPEGTYTLTYQALDPNHNNKVLGNWKYENIKIVQGQNAAEATTEISSINAQKLK